MGLRDAIDDELMNTSQNASEWISEFAEPNVRKAIRQGINQTMFPLPGSQISKGILREILRQILQDNFKVMLSLDCKTGWIDIESVEYICPNCKEGRYCNPSYIKISW